MEIKEGLFYTETHEWVEFTNKGTALVGLADYAQDQLGDIAFINLCAVGDMLSAGEAMGDVESIKAVSDVYAPVSGRVVAVNDEVVDKPELVNSDPYGSWLLEIECDPDTDGLMDAAAYKKFS